MPRGPVVYSLPPGTTPQQPNTPILSSVFNAAMDDLAAALNTAQPIEYGGTNAGTAVGGSDNLSTSATVASAATTDLGSVNGVNATITGTTSITSFGTAPAGAKRWLTFAASLTLTHNATSLILPGAASIITGAGDTATFLSEGSGNWRCMTYQKAAASPIGSWIPLTTGTISNQATVAITGIPTSAKVVKIYLNNISPVTDGVNLQLRTSTNGGSSYDSGASDYWFSQLRSSSGGSTSNVGAQDSRIVLTSTVGNAGGEFASGEITIYNPGLGQPCSMTFNVAHIDNTGAYVTAVGGGARRSSADVDAVQFTFSSGNLNSGQYTVEYRQ